VAGGMAWATDRLTTAFGAAHVLTGTIDRTVDGQNVPWFHVAFLDGVFSNLFSSWNMEFVTPPGAASPPTRLEQRAARYDPSKLAKNVVAVVFALAPTDADKLGQALGALDWKVVSQHGVLTAVSPLDAGARRVVVIQPVTTTRTGIAAVAIEMNRPASHVERMGEATLVAGPLGKQLAILALLPQTNIDGVAAAVDGLSE
jgi:hypothetical protein